jgi:hypothetical protein
MSQTFPYFDLSMSQNFSIFQIHVLIYISRALKTRSRSMSKSQPMFHVSIHVHVQVSTNVSCLNSCPCPSLNQCFMSQFMSMSPPRSMSRSIFLSLEQCVDRFHISNPCLKVSSTLGHQNSCSERHCNNSKSHSKLFFHHRSNFHFKFLIYF